MGCRGLAKNLLFFSSYFFIYEYMKSTTKAGFFLFTLTCLLNMFTRVSAVRMTMKSAFATATRSYKVGVAGAAGGIGQPLSLLLKLDPNVKELSLFDVARTPGVAAVSRCVCWRGIWIVLIRGFLSLLFWNLRRLRL